MYNTFREFLCGNTTDCSEVRLCFMILVAIVPEYPIDIRGEFGIVEIKSIYPTHRYRNINMEHEPSI